MQPTLLRYDDPSYRHDYWKPVLQQELDDGESTIFCGLTQQQIPYNALHSIDIGLHSDRPTLLQYNYKGIYHASVGHPHYRRPIRFERYLVCWGLVPVKNLWDQALRLRLRDIEILLAPKETALVDRRLLIYPPEVFTSLGYTLHHLHWVVAEFCRQRNGRGPFRTNIDLTTIQELKVNSSGDLFQIKATALTSRQDIALRLPHTGLHISSSLRVVARSTTGQEHRIRWNVERLRTEDIESIEFHLYAPEADSHLCTIYNRH